ncbi:MAG: hypothetical protein U1E76_22365 [Planctomycetota bacterium]
MTQASSKNIADGIRSHVSDIGAEMRDLADAAKQTVSDTIEQVKEGAADSYAFGKEKAADLQKGVQSLVREQPVTALLVAAGVGLLVGLLWKRA